MDTLPYVTPDSTPRIREDADYSKVSLTAVEGFVLSRIDGLTKTAELCLITGLPESETVSIVSRLVGLGLVAVPGARNVSARRQSSREQSPRGEPPVHPLPAHPHPSPAQLAESSPRRGAMRSEPPLPRTDTAPRQMGQRSEPPPSRPTLSEAPRQMGQRSEPPPRPAVAPPPPSPPVPPPAPIATPGSVEQSLSYDPAELHEDVEIPLERRKRILDAFYSLENRDHYELLGVTAAADKKQVRNAYFALSKVFHPDTLFGKRLGAFKPKMEVVFKRLTQAYNVLSKKPSRDDYDAYLRSRKGTSAAVALLFEDLQPPASSPPPSPVAPSPPPRPSAVPPPSAVAGAPARVPVGPSTPSVPRSPMPSTTPLTSEDAKRRARELLARRLSGARSVPSVRPPAPSPPPATPRSADDVARDLTRALMDVKTHTGGVSQAVRVGEEGRKAEERGDWVAAANAFRLAVSMEPDSTEFTEGFRHASHELKVMMLPEFEKQATYEERQKEWASAAASWIRVTEGKPDDPSCHGAAARCLRRAGGDARRIQVLARRAVELAPENVELRVLLATVYLEADMPLNAKRELDVAAKLDPKDETVKKLAKDLKERLR